MDSGALQAYVERLWQDSILPELTHYIRIPNQSPAFDPDWQSHGQIERAVGLYERWARGCGLRAMTVEVMRRPGATPLLYIEVPGPGQECILLYGHLDKQPAMGGWRAGLDPWRPVLEGERLYGRGAADDGYAMFAALAALRALQAQGVAHSRCVILIEACEESGSFDLPEYIAQLAARIGPVGLVIALDSGCADYERLWCTTSLRGVAGGTLRTAMLSEGVHSGNAGGVVADSFRIARLLLSRIEDESSGAIVAPFHAPIPELRIRQAEAAAAVLGDALWQAFPFLPGARPLSYGRELILDRTWRPALAVIGAEGLPPVAQAGNVLRPATALRLSLRLPPTLNGAQAVQELKRILEANPPLGAAVSFEPNWGASGWNAPPTAPWLEQALARASQVYFGAAPAAVGEGGTIPFMAMLGERFPNAQFLITGVLGPGSNAHGPNEFLHLPTARKLTACVAEVIAAYHRR